MAKKRTIEIPNQANYKDADEIGLNASGLSIPQAQGGNYSVRVGGSLSASQTSMGRLAESLKGVNQALSIYSDVAERREIRTLKELREMSNEERRKLIGAENEVFRKMGIRPRSILQVKRSLGTVESGNFHGQWQEYLDNTLIENQGRDGSKLTSPQIKQAFLDFRSNFIRENEFLSKSQLGTDGFLADTDGLYDRNAANYLNRADTHYDRTVRDPSIVQNLYTEFRDPEGGNFINTWNELSESNDVTGMRNAIRTIVENAQLTDTETAYEEAILMLSTLGNPKNGAKLGSQPLGDTMAVLVGLGALKESQRAKAIGLSNDLRRLQENEDAERRREVTLSISEMERELAKAKTPSEENAIYDKWQKLALTDEDLLYGGLLNQAIDTVELNRIASAKAKEEAFKRESEKLTNELYVPVEKLVIQGADSNTIQENIESAKEAVNKAVTDGLISEEDGIALGNKFQEIDTRTKRDELVNSVIVKGIAESKLETHDRKKFLDKQSILHATKKAIGVDVGTRVEELELAPTNLSDITYQFDPNNMTGRATTVYIDLEDDLIAERERITRSVFLTGAAESGGKFTAPMIDQIRAHMDAYTKERSKQAVQEMTDVYFSAQLQRKQKEARDLGITVEELEVKRNKESILKKERNLETLADRDLFTIGSPDKDGKVSVDIRNDFFDLNLDSPFSGQFNHKHAQFIEAYELMFTEGNNLFEDLDDKSKARLSARYQEALELTMTDGRNYRSMSIDKYFRPMYNTTARRGRNTVRGEGVTPYQIDRFYNTTDSRFQAEREIVRNFSIGGISPENWMNDEYGDERFSLKGPEGAYEQGLGYRYRETIPFVPVEIIQKLSDARVGDDQEARNISLNKAIEALPDNEREIVEETLNQFYMPKGKDPYTAVGELFDNHRAIYENTRGYSFEDPQNTFIYDTDEDPRAE
tara:strand:+ start:1198 stop:3996 length:2799 start_codon:yes stop_codon:yes gene_type:complete